MECYLEDAEQIGVERSDAAYFALTPNSAGGAGLYIPGQVEQLLRASGKGRWLRMVSEKSSRPMEPVLGALRERLKRYDSVLSSEDRDAVNRTLTLSLGMREAQLVDKVTWRWAEVKKFKPRKSYGATPST